MNPLMAVTTGFQKGALMATTTSINPHPRHERNGQVHARILKHLSHQAPVYGTGPG
jgi:hypothetical protein